MESGNGRCKADERRGEMITHKSECELESTDKLDEDSNPPTDTPIHRSDLAVVEAQIQQLKNMQYQIEIKVERPTSNSTIAEDPLVRLSDWKSVRYALLSGRSIACTEVTEREDTMLHVAAAAKQTDFVSNLVEHLEASELELRNVYGETAFYVAARSEVVEMAKVMYEKNKKLSTIPNYSDSVMIPLEMAIFLRNRKMVKYLCRITPIEYLNPNKFMDILAAIIHIDMYDFKRLYSSLQMRRQARQLAMELWRIFLTLPTSKILDIIQEIEIFHAAAKFGNVEFLTLLSYSYPDLIWNFDSERNSIFHIAVTNRQEEVFSLIYHKGIRKDAIALIEDNDGNNILHLAGKKAPRSRLNIVSGPALQMQRELQWFKAVEKIVGPSYLQTKNRDHKTPRKLFTLEHEKLREDGEKWMKKTVTSCMVVATLIATVVFAAAFTVPGGWRVEAENAVQKFTNQNQNLNDPEDIKPQQTPSLNIYINATILSQHSKAYRNQSSYLGVCFSSAGDYDDLHYLSGIYHPLVERAETFGASATRTDFDPIATAITGKKN
ncbi:ankyrin repeat-containing ITN1-like isoform X1 [Olea europaea subsp. europaea]|uniref:Ankyrin repeat-containing ITN1-like isoform X1 n=1 Tax=Olea europaea subsp. europaea TaxID=158383 RepID=A0A8S0U4S5_OLEEU|nr:ankyrin repeat-containing ITN1-like isoform X1 [Olea europaea subsp. europaea]